MPGLERIRTTRIAANPAALDAARWPVGALVLRIAPDEVLVAGNAPLEFPGDAHAIVEQDEGFAAVWVPAGQALHFLERACEWELPQARPAFAQGAVAGLPMKLWFEADRILFLVPAPYATDLEERMA